MTTIKDGWLVEPRPVFFDDEEAAWGFADVYGGIPVRAKRKVEVPSGVPSEPPSGKHSAQSATPSDAIGELTEDDFAC